MKKIIKSVTNLIKKFIAFVIKVLRMFKLSITFKMPFINVTLALSKIPAPTGAVFLSSTRLAEERRLVVGSDHLQEIPLVAALEETDTSLGILDQIKLRLLHLQRFH